MGRQIKKIRENVVEYHEQLEAQDISNGKPKKVEKKPLSWGTCIALVVSAALVIFILLGIFMPGREPITLEMFEAYINNFTDFTFSDRTADYEDGELLSTQIAIAIDPTDTYCIEYYTYETEENAITHFQAMMEVFNQAITSDAEVYSNSFKDFMVYSITDGSYHAIIGKVGLTSMLCRVPVKDMKTVNDIFIALGYR